MTTAIKSFFARLATMLSRLAKPGSASDGLEVHISKVRIKPGDTVVITTEKRLSIEQCQHIRAAVANALPNAKAMVLHGGLQLSVIRQE